MLWIKAFHIIFMVTWFAGLFYLPRLFVYHASSDDPISLERFLVMERKLFIIMTIGAVATAIFGLWLLFGFIQSAPLWLHIKFGLLALLIIYHIYLGKIIGEFKRGKNQHGHVFYRWLNEAPALFLIAIVLLAVLKPF